MAELYAIEASESLDKAMLAQGLEGLEVEATWKCEDLRSDFSDLLNCSTLKAKW